MNTSQYLNQIGRIDRVINNKLAEIYQLKSMVCSIGVVADENKVQTSPEMDKLGSAVAKIVDLENEINCIIDKYRELRIEIVSKIERIDDEMQYQVLFSRYIERKTYEKIADDTGYSERQIIRIHKSALIEFEKRYGKEYSREMSLNVTI